MKAEYLYHSGFAIFGESANLLIDYYAHPNCPPLPEALFNGRPLYVLCSHGHHDHYSEAILSFPKKYGAKLIVSRHTERAAGRNAAPMTVLKPGETFNDGALLVSAYGSTDEGVSFYIELDKKRIFHAGDLNDWHWQEESTQKEVEEAHRQYEAILKGIAKDHPEMDAVFFPVDPRMATDIGRGAREFLSAVSCRAFIPMHFWEDFSAANAFAPEAESLGARFISLRHAGEIFEI